MSRFSKMPPRTSVPSGVTKGNPGSAPAASHNRTNKELQMNRITVAFLAEQTAAQNVRMDRLMSTVESLVGVVARLIPGGTAPAAPVAVAAPVPAVVVAAESVAAAADDAVTRRNAALARGRATAAANRAARKAGTTPAPVAAPAAAPAPAPAAPVAAAPKVVQLTKGRANGTTVHTGTVGAATYVVAWNRTAAAWDWQIAVKGGKTAKGQVPNGDAARAVAFRALNAAAAAMGQSQVRAGK